MERVVCPHCDSPRIGSARGHKDVVVVMPCPACSELVVLYRRKVIALDRSVLEKGTHQERKMHIAGIIAEFLEPGLLKFAIPSADTSELEQDEDDFFITDEDSLPITDKEVQDFSRINLRRLDNADYFKRHLG